MKKVVIRKGDNTIVVDSVKGMLCTSERTLYIDTITGRMEFKKEEYDFFYIV